MSDNRHPEPTADLMTALREYTPARRRLMSFLNLPASNRDPLAEWSEHLVAALTVGKLADSRVQPGFDVTLADARTVQVRYLANATTVWVNEHHVRSILGVDLYALVLFEGFEVVGVVAFPNDLARVCGLLGKRHPRQETELQFTRRNWQRIQQDADAFRAAGAQVWTPPF